MSESWKVPFYSNLFSLYITRENQARIDLIK